MIKDFIVLTKFVLSFAVSLSALLAYIMAKGEIGTDMFLATLAVLLVAMGVSTLNQVQEYKEDALMERTKYRPIASGKWSPRSGVIVAVILILSSLALIYTLIGMIGVDLFLFAFIWYNIVYTPLKKKSALAVVPGALLGVIPPAIGWITAGSSLMDPQFFALGLFYFVWQVPHFWLLVMLHYGDYDNGGYPTAMKLFGKNTLQKLTFVWLVMTIQTGYFMVSIFEPASFIINILLLLTAILAFASSLQLLYNNFELKHARKVFVQINLTFLGTVILISIDEMLKFNALS
ncbi:UbiA family prenyltransferase [Sulfurimonas sp. SAG-AH-194-C20]|nr:UbiA family prenyltransferase [Sulfurimonas sp. SAG-AH-194-C20]MDF1879576.1 UbiA family prenyltransferase [Sulfurimonas sp. SAG-AH-194-C20]